MTLGEFKEWLKNYASIESKYHLFYDNEDIKSNSTGIYKYTFKCRFNSNIINIECWPKRKECKIYQQLRLTDNFIEIPEDLKNTLANKIGYKLVS